MTSVIGTPGASVPTGTRSVCPLRLAATGAPLRRTELGSAWMPAGTTSVTTALRAGDEP